VTAATTPETPDETPETPETSDTVMISGVEGKTTIMLEEGQTLVSANPNIASVKAIASSDTDWEVTAKKKGSTTLSVEDENGKELDTITVEIGNTAPTADEEDTGLYYTLEEFPNDDVVVVDARVSGFTQKYSPGLERSYHRVQWVRHPPTDAADDAADADILEDIRELFKDKDSDKLTLTATSQSSAVNLVDIDDDGNLVVDVVRFEGAGFTIVLKADDGDNGTASVELDVRTTNPLSDDDYKVRELPNKEFASLKVHERHAIHSLTFTELVTAGELAFVKELIGKPAPDGYDTAATAYPDTSSGTKPPASPAVANYVTVAGTSGPISGVAFVADTAPGNTVPTELNFTVSGSNKAVITVTAHVVRMKLGTNAKPTDMPQATFDALPAFNTATASKTIAVDIMRVRGANSITQK
jgi:hypothetical protein